MASKIDLRAIAAKLDPVAVRIAHAEYVALADSTLRAGKLKLSRRYRKHADTLADRGHSSRPQAKRSRAPAIDRGEAASGRVGRADQRRSRPPTRSARGAPAAADPATFCSTRPRTASPRPMASARTAQGAAL